MPQESLHEKEELEKLESAAEHATEPEHIEQKAAQEEIAPPQKLFWFIPYLLGSSSCRRCNRVSQWHSSFCDLSATTIEKIQRYLLGVLGVIVVLAAARAAELHLIERLANPVSRFNLKRILRSSSDSRSCSS